MCHSYRMHTYIISIHHTCIWACQFGHAPLETVVTIYVWLMHVHLTISVAMADIIMGSIVHACPDWFTCSAVLAAVLLCVWSCLHAVLSSIEFKHMTYLHVLLAWQRKFEPLCAIISSRLTYGFCCILLWILFLLLHLPYIDVPRTLLYTFGIMHLYHTLN